MSTSPLTSLTALTWLRNNVIDDLKSEGGQLPFAMGMSAKAKAQITQRGLTQLRVEE